MYTTTDNFRGQIKAKLEELVQQLKKAKTQGEETAKLHQIVIANLNMNNKNKEMLTVYVNATKENLKKTELQLASMEKRIAIGEELLKLIEDTDKLDIVIEALLVIGAEQIPQEDKAKA